MYDTRRLSKPAILLQHGLLCAADNWANNGDLSPAFLLARAGYDVWLGNNRGNMYGRSRSWINFKLTNKAYFDYSFYDNGRLDTVS